MKKHWKILALVLAALLLCTACEERKVVDISDGGDMIGSDIPAAAPKTEAPAPADKAEATSAPETEEPEEKTEVKTEDKAGDKTSMAGLATGKVSLREMSMKAKGKGMCLVPLDTGAVFVLNNVLTETCTITTDPNDFVSADCTVKAAEGMDALLEFVLLQGDKEVVTAKLSASLNEGENSIQVLIRLGSAASGEYTGRLYVNGELIGESSVTA